MGETEIRALVLQYLTGTSALRELDAALAGIAWDEMSPASTRNLANSIALRIDEYSSGACDEAQLRDALRPFVTHYTVYVAMGTTPTVQVQTANSSFFVPAPLMTSRVSGTRYVTVPS
jgi:hypothetical protein